MITWWIKLGGNRPPGDNPLLFLISGTGSFIWPVAQTLLDITRPLITQSHRHGWTYQGLWLPSHTDTAGHTKAFDYPVTQTRLDIPRPLVTQSHRHGWTFQGLWLPSHTDTAGHTKTFDYPVTQTRLDIPRPLITQSHRHGWTYQGLWLPSHTDTAGHTKVFDYPVTQTQLDIPRPLITQSHRHGWTYQGLWLPSHTDTAGHTKAFDYPVTHTPWWDWCVPLPPQGLPLKASPLRAAPLKASPLRVSPLKASPLRAAQTAQLTAIRDHQEIAPEDHSAWPAADCSSHGQQWSPHQTSPPPAQHSHPSSTQHLHTSQRGRLSPTNFTSTDEGIEIGEGRCTWSTVTKSTLTNSCQLVKDCRMDLLGSLATSLQEFPWVWIVHTRPVTMHMLLACTCHCTHGVQELQCIGCWIV